MKVRLNIPLRIALGVGAWAMAACGEQGPASTEGEGEAGGEACAEGSILVEQLVVPDTYSFEAGGASTVSCAGQTGRHVLLSDLKSYVGALTAKLDAGSLIPEEGVLVAAMQSFFDYDGDTMGAEEHGVSTSPAAQQRTYADFPAKALKDKLAGIDNPLPFDFVGWGDVQTPEALVDTWFGMVEALAIQRANGEVGTTPAGEPLASVYVSAEGHNLAELLQKFLLGAVAFSQGAQDYLGDIPGKGLSSDNIEPAGEGKPYTALAHHWDEGFGYFGAARDYGSYSDEEIAKKGGRDDWQGHHDSNADGAIDLLSEANLGHSLNAAKRDRGSAGGAHPSDLTQEAWDAFRTGRSLITRASGRALRSEEMCLLRSQRDKAIHAWEKAIAASVVHYINEVIGDMESERSADCSEGCYDFYAHAKHWSELKGFALTLQFNPRSPLMAEDGWFDRLHSLLGTAPALPGADNFEAYDAGLLEARSILQQAYGLAEGNVEAW